MFSFLMTQAARARRDAKNWLEVAEKVYHYRRDQLSEAELGELNQRREELKAKLKAKADAAQLKLAVEALEKTLHRTGGRVYPKGGLADNVEFFLAAAIVILGIRAFFVQPFKIPTNSMWPTYFGMKHEVFLDPKNAPGPVAQLLRLAAFGATRREIVAPVSGELKIPVVPNREDRIAVPGARQVPGRKWLVVPTQLKEYTLYVGDAPVSLRVPADFDFDTLVMETFLGGKLEGKDAFAALQRAGKIEEAFLDVTDGAGRRRAVRVPMLKTGRSVSRGEVAFSFDVLTGDQLFVDRFSNNFFEPKVGEGFVFRTGNIKGIGQDQYYIKRLVGRPGDTLEIKEPVLYRNGEPIDGAEAFNLNANQVGLYRGYQASGLLATGRTLTVDNNHFFALGDNSYNSADGRYWGFVPAKDAIGRPLFIYYPFTKRWGPAR
ncbi:MAG TPA: signal peptidase I [Opitutaceae bacterium]|nr:signal peptidase I [Opitutaceae bacterium]